MRVLLCWLGFHDAERELLTVHVGGLPFWVVIHKCGHCHAVKSPLIGRAGNAAQVGVSLGEVIL